MASLRAQLDRVRIRSSSLEDLTSILKIQNEAFPSGGWTANDYVRLIQDSEGLFIIAELSEVMPCQMVGFAALRRACDQAELLSLAVAPDYRRMGIGRALLREVIFRLESLSVRTLYLEVRPSNHAALSLYHSEGFMLNSIRHDYYNHPHEDAFVLSRVIPAARNDRNS
ncbi:MAG TPA: ribosomal protein S18-alanine N-acetyltransferase [Terriglobia bacterium]|nr:ribosomal protein S18-alanine N-acetyltransferase [Terriglobia bacterium]